MELSQHGFLEELLASTPWSSSYSNGFNDFFQNTWNFGCFDENPQMGTSISPHFPALQTATDFSFADQHLYTNFIEGFAMPELDSSSYTRNNETPPFVSQEEMSNKNSGFPPVGMEEEELGFMEAEAAPSVCKVEMEQMGGRETNDSKMGVAESRKRTSNKAKKIEGQPSKNLMAERRRRKRLNDRLSMLRAIVPKISKMDRTSILGDTIDYVKELLERINNLKEEDEFGLDSNHVGFNAISKEGKPNEVQVRNSPKFDIEKRESKTRIDICCATRPGLLLSTVNTLEALGLEIQQCVISCFNDFSMQACCSEQGSGEKAVASSDDIKEALFRNAGYGGKCL
ncbi:Transcription factor bHLH93 [Cucurbita argyrosperma subsp. argyrosperma]|uniref:Transcription factor bHLH93-like isoform X1 n=1 Tax=Cucurbita moschata TaxID=3662 RepID=A0A6J1GCM1_CUCMO|nr:transcription factor bHLH93-like isoform X1 [Cucurbita moschata]KAG7034243.1 Transcription factor bHLH93 [Cucurbita argyrosperma subsp. argyrosperma]